jgi:hypothetical protein
MAKGRLLEVAVSSFPHYEIFVPPSYSNEPNAPVWVTDKSVRKEVFRGKFFALYRWFDKHYPGWRKGRPLFIQVGSKVRIEGFLAVWKVSHIIGRVATLWDEATNVSTRCYLSDINVVEE